MSAHLLTSTLSATTDLRYLPHNFTNPSISSSNGPGAGVKIATCLLLAFCFTVGLPVNVAVIVDICRKYKRYVSKVNPSILLLVLNLAVVDSVSLSTLPFTAYTLVWGFTSGDTACKMLFYVLTTCLFISVFTVTGISMSYFLIVKFGVANPRMMAQVSGRRRKLVVLGGVWIAALLLSIAALYTHKVETWQGLLGCIRKAHSDTLVAVLFLETVVGYVLPVLILLTSYVCLYRKTAKMATSASSTEQTKKIYHFVVSVLATFLICWTPYHIINMLDISTTLTSSPAVYGRLKAFRNPAGDGMKTMCLLNSVINPFLYAFALRRKLNKSDTSSNHSDTNDKTVQMVALHSRSCETAQPIREQEGGHGNICDNVAH